MNAHHQPKTDHHRGMKDDGYWNVFTSDFGDYELGPAIGFGASSTVYEAIFTVPPTIQPIPTNTTITTTTTTPDDDNSKRRRPSLSISVPSDRSQERICAIKVSTSHPDVDLLSKEIKMLGLCRHPNVLRILSTFTLPPDHHRICLVTPFIPGGSLSGILSWRSRLITTPKTHHFPSFRLGHRKSKHHDDNDNDDNDEEDKGRLDEEEIKCVTKQVLEGLGYLHTNGFLHRDVKAGNLLVDQDGTILLADFGVGGDLNAPPSPVRSRKNRLAADELKFDSNKDETPKILQNGFGPGKKDNGFIGGEDLRKRKSFVGTPNWMAPEVILGQKYDQKADIWSLGITLLELAHGSVPGWKYKPNKALSHIITDPSPTLDRSVGGYSKLMKEFIDLCLNKDPAVRPIAKTLSEHHWLKGAKKNSFLAQSLLADVPPLAQRQELRRVPTKSSLLSHASSWDFSNTPNPSIPSSPIRSSLLIPSARSPSISSHMEYFNSIGRTGSHSHSHSRTSSFSGLPPSPRVSLRQWAEKSYDESTTNTNNNNLSLNFRTGSERGSKRKSLASAGLLRKGKSTNTFDYSNTNRSFPADIEAISTSFVDVKIRQSTQTPELGGLRDLKLDEVQSQPTIGIMSPVMEITKSQQSQPTASATSTPEVGNHVETFGLGISDAMLGNESKLDDRQGFSESPENMSEGHLHHRPDELHKQNQVDEREEMMANNGKMDNSSAGIEGESPQQQVDRGSTEEEISLSHDGSKVPQPPTRSPTIVESSNDHSSGLSNGNTINGKIEQAQYTVQAKEKKNWLSIKRNELNSYGNTNKPLLTRITSSSKSEMNDHVHISKQGEHAMGKTGSWQGVLGRVTGKIRECQI
ncbi:hypothetical protein I203_100723 [Kwoniella mangroviensis CBS 8507]|uniref:uncharacterized protein n=1 Tax=Kwoniella mangroviensis CBS 8507 TaxID=1296122 RepID=UPI00080D29DC|nr:STE/STE20/FRAY protein kinase [Kwoniella mangroviensis CBS 8507]OCF64160.1 STE/STE20/FRAY protein kinase [Kwoniella mangroviensis CBS 8507]